MGGNEKGLTVGMIALIIGITAASVGVGLLALSKDQKDNYVEMEEVGSPYSIIIYRETVGSSSKDENERIIELAQGSESYRKL